jgi:hypothetical protein
MGLDIHEFIMVLSPVDECNTLWVIVDRLTRMACFVPYLDTMKPEQLVDRFIFHILHPHGFHNSIISDYGSLLALGFWTYIMRALGMTWNLSMVFYPEMDGQTE